MKANELMIGDWVQSRGKIEQVTSVYKGYICTDSFEDSHDYYFEPIPLTAEILEKNGFDCNQDAKTSIDLVYHGCARITEYGEEVLEDGKMIRYVHELQHALRLCGLTELADNFKI